MIGALVGDPIAPPTRLDAIFASDVALLARFPTRAAGRWLPADGADLRTGNTHVVHGELPLVAHVAADTAAGRALALDAGLQPAARVHHYGSEAELCALVRRLWRGGTRLAVQHVHPASQIPPAAYVVARRLMRVLNDKAGLGALVPRGVRPRRRVVARTALAGVLARCHRAVVVKAATSWSTGGGTDVAIVAPGTPPVAVTKRFAGAHAVVVEEHLRFERSFCLTYAILPDGTVGALGAAEQICDDTGRYHGNWIERDPPVPVSLWRAAESVATTVAARGHRGVLGLDGCVDARGRPRIFDVNARLNGSTPALLLRDQLLAARGACVLRSGRWHRAGSLDALVRAVRPLVRSGLVVPLAASDVRATGGPGDGCALFACLALSDRAELPAALARLAAAGLR